MKETYQNDTSIQKEALINEFKGNLFEFLVAQGLARHYGIERSFLEQFQGPLRQRFSHYEGWLRQYRPELLRRLPLLAKELVKQAQERLPSDISQVQVVGKLDSETKGKESFEADIILSDQSRAKNYPISLKLCKDRAYVNTKSGGVRSFLTRYFSAFEQAEKAQERLNNTVDFSFQAMAQDLCDMADLDVGAQLLECSFEKVWSESGYPSLPGQLPPQMKKRVNQSYRPIIESIHQEIYRFWSLDLEKFKNALMPIVGIGRDDIFQMICFYTQDYEFGRALFLDGPELAEQLGEMDFAPWDKESEISSFEIVLPKLRLQIRVKPMNRFTAAAPKINCSLKARL